MGVLRLAAFNGTWPQRDPRALPDTASTAATNIRVDGGAYLKPLDGPSLVKSVAGATKSVFRIPLAGADTWANSYWMEFADADTDVLLAPIVNDSYERIYWASPSTGMKYAPKANITGAGSTYLSGVTAPTGRPVVNVVGGTGTTGGDTETRSYTVTFINTYGEESQPGTTREVTGLADASYALTSIPQPVADATRAPVVTIRIYRTVSGTGGGTTFYKVADIASGTTNYTDSIDSATVTGQTQMESISWAKPPTIVGLVAMPNGIFVGWNDRTLYFSENYRPHAWPAEYAIQVDSPIVGLGVVGTSCVVCTQGRPYMVSGIKSASMSLTKIDAPLPCLSRRSIVASQEGVYWATEEGIAYAGPGGSGVITRDLIARDQWATGYYAAQLRSHIVGGVYTSFPETAGGGFSFMPQNPAARGVSAISPPVKVRNTGLEPYSGKPWIIGIDNNLYEWNAPGATDLSYTWLSKPFNYLKPTNFNVFQVFLTGTLTLRVYATLRGGDSTQTRTLVYTTTLTESGKERKLPSGFKSDLWEVEFEGSGTLELFLMANSVEELRRA